MQTATSLTEKRRAAAGAVRSQLRRMGIAPASVSAADALAVLDDLARCEPDLLASEWYAHATDAQIRAFRKEWQR